MDASGAFSEYSSADRLEAASLPPTGSARNPLVALTRGLTSVLPPRGVGASGASGWELLLWVGWYPLCGCRGSWQAFSDV